MEVTTPGDNSTPVFGYGKEKSNATVYSFLFYTDVDKLVITVILPIIFTVGVLGNCAVVLVFYRIKEMRTVTNCYLIALSISDLTFLLSSIPRFWVSYLKSPIPEDIANASIIYCKLSLYTSDVSFIVSCLLIFLVTVERYFAINWSLKSKRLSTRRRAIIYCWIVWIVVIIYKIPDLVFVTVSQFHLDRAVFELPTEYPMEMRLCLYCDLMYPSKACIKFEQSLLAEAILPLAEILPMTLLYTMIIVKLKRHYNFTLPRQLTNGHSNRIHLRRETQVTRLLVVTVIVFVICVTPFQFLHSINDNLRSKILQDYPNFRNLSRVLLYLNSAINPLLYNIVSAKFRHAFKKVFVSFCLVPYHCTHQFKSSTREIHLELNESSRNRALE